MGDWPILVRRAGLPYSTSFGLAPHFLYTSTVLPKGRNPGRGPSQVHYLPFGNVDWCFFGEAWAKPSYLAALRVNSIQMLDTNLWAHGTSSPIPQSACPRHALDGGSAGFPHTGCICQVLGPFPSPSPDHFQLCLYLKFIKCLDQWQSQYPRFYALWTS